MKATEDWMAGVLLCAWLSSCVALEGHKPASDKTLQNGYLHIVMSLQVWPLGAEQTALLLCMSCLQTACFWGSSKPFNLSVFDVFGNRFMICFDLLETGG